MSKKYLKPPIIEALCEFQFGSDSPWDLTMPGLIYDKLRRQGFVKRQQAKHFAVNFLQEPEGVQQQVQSIDRIKFLRDDERVMVQVGRNLLAINHLAPYSSWQEFRPCVEIGFNAYREVAEPKAIHRVGVRYINRIEIPGLKGDESIELKDYFESYPYLSKRLPDFNAFNVQVILPYETGRDIMRLQLAASDDGPPNTLVAILDLDYFLAEPGALGLDKALQWVDNAHLRVEEVFENSIKEALREIFQEVR